MKEPLLSRPGIMTDPVLNRRGITTDPLLNRPGITTERLMYHPSGRGATSAVLVAVTDEITAGIIDAMTTDATETDAMIDETTVHETRITTEADDMTARTIGLVGSGEGRDRRIVSVDGDGT